MLRKDIQDFYFKAMDVLFEGGFCPKESLIRVEGTRFICDCGTKTVEDCKECISEYIINSTKADKEMVDLILGE